MIIRPLDISELPLCVGPGQRFHAEMQLPGAFVPEVFLRNWNLFLPMGNSVILTLWKEAELCGGIGGMVVPDLLDDRLCATEFFWFMEQAHRHATGGIRLVSAFEAWAATKHAVEVRMMRLKGLRDEQLSRVYEKRGYTEVETAYSKPLKGLV